MKITIYVQPGAKRTAVIGKHGEYVKVAVKAPPVEGKANKALTIFAAEILELPQSGVSVVSGQNSRLKTIAFDENKASVAGIRLLQEGPPQK